MNSRPVGSDKLIAGIISILIGCGLMVLNYFIVESGEFHMRVNNLNIDKNSFLFWGKLIISGITSLFFIGSGIKAILDDTKNKRTPK